MLSFIIFITFTFFSCILHIVTITIFKFFFCLYKYNYTSMAQDWVCSREQDLHVWRMGLWGKTRRMGLWGKQENRDYEENRKQVYFGLPLKLWVCFWAGATWDGERRVLRGLFTSCCSTYVWYWYRQAMSELMSSMRNWGIRAINATLKTNSLRKKPWAKTEISRHLCFGCISERLEVWRLQSLKKEHQ